MKYSILVLISIVMSLPLAAKNIKIVAKDDVNKVFVFKYERGIAKVLHSGDIKNGETVNISSDDKDGYYEVSLGHAIVRRFHLRGDGTYNFELTKSGVTLLESDKFNKVLTEWDNISIDIRSKVQLLMNSDTADVLKKCHNVETLSKKFLNKINLRGDEKKE